MKKIILAFAVFALIILAGCINLTYEHTINPDGSSTLKQMMDLTGYIEYMKTSGAGTGQAIDASQLSAFCTTGASQFTEGTSCSVEGNSVILKKSFTKQDGFYSFESSGGLFGGKYKVVISKIPAKAFMKENTNDTVGGAGGGLGSGAAGASDIDFSDKAKNLQTGTGAKTIGMNMTYVVEMPAPITKATAGKYSAKIGGNKASFDLLQVFDDSEPLVIEAEGGNGMLLIVAVVIVVLVVLLLLWFFVFNKKTGQP